MTAAWAAFSTAGFLFLALLWARQLKTRNAATADIGWSILMLAGAILGALTTRGDPARRLLVAALAVVWAGRLALHLIGDRAGRSVPEDGRYRALRDHWGADAERNFLALYLGQGIVASLFVVPLVTAMRGGALDGWAVAGAGVWVVAVLGESVADRQLARFRADPARRGQVCRTGLWAWSRHPNYFFEWLHWWSYVLIGHGAALTFVGPVVMFLFLFRVTGIPWTEAQSLRSRGEAYREYQRTTSAFLPWPPRRSVQ